MGVYQDADYAYGLEVPHLLNIRPDTVSMIVPRWFDIQVGTVFQTEYGRKFTVTETLERRPARGTWNAYADDMKPEFLKVSYI